MILVILLRLRSSSFAFTLMASTTTFGRRRVTVTCSAVVIMLVLVFVIDGLTIYAQSLIIKYKLLIAMCLRCIALIAIVQSSKRKQANRGRNMSNENNESFNPNNIPSEDLPTIYGFNNGGSAGFMDAVLMAEDGGYLGGHLCSHEGFMPGDLGIRKGSRPDRHEDFRNHYPHGYQMEFVRSENIGSHAGLTAAIAANKKALDASEASSDKQ